MLVSLRQLYMLPDRDRKLQIKISIVHCHSLLARGRPPPRLANSVTSGAWQGGHFSTNFKATGMHSTRESKYTEQAEVEPRPTSLEADAFSTRPTKPSPVQNAAQSRTTVSSRRCKVTPQHVLECLDRYSPVIHKASPVV